MNIIKNIFFFLIMCYCNCAVAQQKWINVDSLFTPLPNNFHVYKCSDSLEGKPFVAFYASILLKEKSVNFTTDTTFNRRFTPQQFYQKNNQPLLVVNGTFFNFQKNKNLNVVVKNGNVLAYNLHTIAGKGKDTLTYRHVTGAAIGIDKNLQADVAWVLSDSNSNTIYATQNISRNEIQDSISNPLFEDLKISLSRPSLRCFYGPRPKKVKFKKWEMQTAIGGGPALVQQGKEFVTNNEELKFAGKEANDKHPRTCMGYTKDGHLIIMVVQGRTPNVADGATLYQAASLLKNIGCVEALNLDGGGSTCMLINGKEVFKPSDATGQRAVPAVFIVNKN
jgi:exopolysaccharide biosynthesis protein